MHFVFIYKIFVALFSYSCGYRRVYEEYIGILKQKYPELHITGENYHPPGYNMYIAKFLVNKYIFFLFFYTFYIYNMRGVLIIAI